MTFLRRARLHHLGRIGDAEVARRMGRTTSYASTYKRRLLKQGVIGERPGGTLDFDVPMLREFLADVEG